MLILQPGNDDGYALLDAVLALFLASLLAGIVATGIGTAVRLSTRICVQAQASIEERNEAVLHELAQEYR